MQALTHFILANASYLLTGKLRSKHGFTPRQQHIVPQDFACIGVATSSNPVTDQYIIEQLRLLGIAHVRLDVSYDDFESDNSRFLGQLLHLGFKVHLHLVQPFAAAKGMETSPEQAQWQQFVEKICTLYGPSVELIEVGSTINRRRWAGYTLNGFLSMWAISHRIIKAHNITLAGPSITDFEPLYNIGILSLLKERQQLPDIHTNNLFSERCTEPERDDHKILGHTFAPLLGYRLVKKAFLLQAIGEHFGVPNIHSPAAFWTLPRIGRLLPDTLEKQADYLSRYMLLCAASGALKSAAWGPFICHREGLIDDGVTPYPQLERITHYRTVGADLSLYQVRPAFKAYQAFIKLIPGLKYDGQLNTSDFLQVHRFASHDYQLHALWTNNGKVAALQDIYTQAQLQQAIFIDRDGQQCEEPPSVVTESPLYIRFVGAQAISIQSDVRIIASAAIHAHMPHAKYFSYRQGAWRGLITAQNTEQFNLLAHALNPSLLLCPNKQNTLRHARNAIWTIPDPRDSTKQLVVKQPVKMHLHKKWLDRYKPSKALRSWSGSHELLRRGMNNAKPIAYFEHTDDTTLTQNFYICEYVPADFSVRELFSAFAQGQAVYEGISTQTAYQQVCDYLFNMHSKGVFFRDLSGGNILINKISDTALQFSLIDTARAHFFNHGTKLSKRLSDMARACNKLHAAGRNEIMSMYMTKMGKTFGFRQKIPFFFYNTKVAIKRSLKLKNIKKKLGLHKKT